MSTSPPIEIKGSNPEINARPQLVHLAQLFKATVQNKPAATLNVMGSSSYYNDLIAQALEKLQVPRHKIVPLTISTPFASAGFNSRTPSFNGQQSAGVYIDYFNGKPGKQRFSVEFKPDDKQFPIEVECEASPDGTMVEAIEAGWTPLTAVVADSARQGVRNVNISTKLIGAAGFERTTLNKIETELKLRLKQTFDVFLRTRGSEFLKIQFYGVVSAKYEENKVKPDGEAGVLFEIPFDVTDLFK